MALSIRMYLLILVAYLPLSICARAVMYASDSIQLDSIECNSVQINSIQFNSIQRKAIAFVESRQIARFHKCSKVIRVSIPVATFDPIQVNST